MNNQKSTAECKSICIGYVIDNGANRIEAIGYVDGDFDTPLSITIEGDVSREELKVLGLNYLEDMDLANLETSLVHLNRYVKQFGKIMRADRVNDGCA